MQAIDQATTAEQIADRLRTAIVHGRFKPNDRLIEQELSETFEVSRGPVREAIRLLAGEGVVVLRKNRGAVVASPTMDDVLEVYALRLALGEIAIATTAEAGTVSEREAAGLTRMVAKLRDPKVQADADRMIDADLAFQSAVIAHSGLPRFTESFARTNTDIKVFVRALGIRYDEQDHRELAARHERLVTALQQGDAVAAVVLWRDHITTTVREFSQDTAGLERPGLRHLLTTGAHHG
jgi:DNA-binding GntR family transcriptional regulator